MTHDQPAGAAGRFLPAGILTWIWTAGTVAWLVPALLLTYGVVSWLPRALWPSFGPDHGVDLAASIVTWGVLGMAGAAALARLLVGSVAVLHRAALITALAGLVLVAALQLTLSVWVISKFGYYEPDIIGPTNLLPFGLAALTVALFGIAVAPRAFDLAPRLSVVVGGLLALAIVALNLPGAVDGIAPRAVPLAVVLAIVPGYVLVSWAIALRR